MNKTQTIKDMIFQIEEYAKDKNISLENNIPNNVNEFDDLFKDGGEGRCEHFADLSWEYASNFGKMEDYDNSKGFRAHSCDCIEKAMIKLQNKYNKI